MPKNILSLLSRCIRGNVALTFAIAAPVLFQGVGMTVDYARKSGIETEMQSAADAAALFARRNFDDDGNWKEAAANVFKENTKEISFRSEPVISATRPDSDSLKVNVSASLKPVFMQIFGYPKLDVKVSSTVTAAPPNYLHIAFLVDTSQSMGVGATPKDHTLMTDATGCAFACHYIEDVPGSYTNETYTGARAAGATLRIDVIRDAMKNFVTGLDKVANAPGQLEYSIHTFGNGIEQLLASTTDKDKILAAVNGVKLRLPVKYLGTDIRRSIAELAKTLPIAGDGSSPNRRKSIVILLTDGIEDESSAELNAAKTTVTKWILDTDIQKSTPRRETAQVPPATMCAPLEVGKHQLYIGHFYYEKPAVGLDGRDVLFNWIKDTANPEIETRLKNCTPDSKYFLVTDTSQTNDTLQKMAKNILRERALFVAK